jgi:hypothetical protein
MPTQNDRGIYDNWIAGEQLEAAPLDHNMRMIVSVSGNQTVNGVKTFGSIPVGPASNPTTDNQLTRKKYVDDQDALDVHLSGDQTIAGVKTFSSIPVLPGSDPTSDNQASRKAYVDRENVKNSGHTVGTPISDTETTDTVITHGLSVVPELIIVRTKGKGNMSFGVAKTNKINAVTEQHAMTLYNNLVIPRTDADVIALNTYGTNCIPASIVAVSSTTFTIRFNSAHYSGADGTPEFDWEVFR